ncbi:MAG: chromosome partitioning protein ParA [Pseudomonadota bacterium]|nr:chromosome partitioning protein ParA [Pseudomonadota bacterium]
MTQPTSLPWRRWLGGALLLASPLLGWAQADPPSRVAYVSAAEGAVQIATDGQRFAPASINWPVTTGTRIVTDPGARAELHGGETALRLTGPADLSVTALNDDTTQVALMDGTASVRVRRLQPGERVEIDTPHLAVVANQAGEYRVDVDRRADTTRVTVHAGTATVYGEAGQSTTMDQHQQMLFTGRDLQIVQRGGAAYRDGFDQWVAQRNALEDRSSSARYVPRDMPGYHQLDAHGEWARDATYGPVWYPRVSVSDWAPYRYGRWAWVDPWGWTWVDDAPWGFAPSHYGRWAQIGPRWAWVPGSFGPRPVYAPALVAFMSGDNWSLSVGSPGAAWFPLAPGEPWHPHYHASDRYWRGLNWGDGRVRRPANDGYHFQRRPGAISVAPIDQFGGGKRDRRPRHGDGSRLPSGALTGTRIITPPPRAYVPGVSTQAPPPSSLPLPMPRPDRHGMTDPRDTRIGADRGILPPPLPSMPRGDDRRRVFQPPVNPRPGPDMMERDRYLRHGPPPALVNQGGAMAEQQRMQQQLQRQQQERLRELQMRAPAMPSPRAFSPGELGGGLQRPAPPMHEPAAMPQREQRRIMMVQ